MSKIENILCNIISNKTKENKQYSLKNIISYNDILDYYITRNNNKTIINYTYYKNIKNENEYVSSKIYISHLPGEQ